MIVPDLKTFYQGVSEMPALTDPGKDTQKQEI